MKSLIALGAAAFAVSAPLAAQATVASTQTSTYHFDSGTSLTNNQFGSFSGSTKAGQFLAFSFLPGAGAADADIVISNLQITGPWKVTASDAYAAYSDASLRGVTFKGLGAVYANYLAGKQDLSPLMVTVPNYVPGTSIGNFFSLPISTFGDSFSFDLSETGPATPGVSSDLVITAQDDTLSLLNLKFTPGGGASVVSSASGVSIAGTGGTSNPAPVPEFASSASFGLMALAFAGVVLRSRKRSAA